MDKKDKYSETIWFKLKLGKWPNFEYHVGKWHKWSPRFKEDPRVGWDELEPNRSYLSHFPTWYSKLGHFPIEIPIKNEKWPPTPSYGSIILKIVLWAYFTSSHAVLKGLRDKTTKPNFGTGYFALPDFIHQSYYIIAGNRFEAHYQTWTSYGRLCKPFDLKHQ